MSLITLQQSPSIENEMTNNETKTNHKQQYLEAMRQPSDQLVSLESDSKIESFDKEFNFQDLKEIYATSSLPIKLTKKVPPLTNKVLKSTSHVRVNILEDVMNSSMSSENRQLFEKYFLVKDAALILPRRLKESKNSSYVCPAFLSSSSSSLTTTDPTASNNKSDSADPALSMAEPRLSESEQEQKQQLVSDSTNSLDQSSGDILVHLKSMVQLLRPIDTISVAVKLFSYHPNRARYLVVVETPSYRQPNATTEVASEESAILGIDLQLNQTSEESHSDRSPSTPSCSVGLVIPIYANCEISLNGDGGFKFKTHQSTHIFKPVSIQAMWSAYQYLNKALENSSKFKFYSVVPINSLSSTVSNEMNQISQENSLNLLPLNHQWVKHYTAFIGKNKMEQQYLNEWYQKEDRSAQREEFTTPYFDQNCLTKEQEETGVKIREKLKEIMINSKDDYGSMSSIAIRNILEKELQMNLDNFKKFVDVTIFQFYNQLVECASQILPFLYLGTEWNASNYDSLVSDGITHILNVSSDVDNFFPDAFKYLNIRVRDVDETDLLKEFDRTNKFIQEARDSGTVCLVHCKMGVSRSASVVLAYLMKEYHYSLESAFNFTKQKRTCINPNDGFRIQLATYESILNAHRAKYSIFEPNQANGSTNNGSDLASSIANDETSRIESDQTDMAETGCSDKCSFSPDKNKSSSWNTFVGTCSDMVVVKDSPKVIGNSPNEIFKETTNELKSYSGGIEPNRATVNNVQKLANVYMGKKTRSLPTSFSQQMISSSMPIESSRFSLSLVHGDVETEQHSVNELVPLGTVKRQVESINFKLKTSQPDNIISQSENDSEMTIDNQQGSFANLQSNNKHLEFQTITRSPDSKRCKWESLNATDAEPVEMKNSKKVFDFLAGKYNQLKRENTERISNSLNLELQQPVAKNSDGVENNSQLSLITNSPSSKSNGIILNIKKNEISDCQTV